MLIAVVSTHLTDAQQAALLDEAQSAYQFGTSQQQSDPFSAKKSFKTAAQKFKLLTDSGIENGKLWYNQGNAYLQCEEVGEAIAAYRSAERFIPTDARLKSNLAYARSMISGSVSVSDESASSPLEQLAFWHHGLSTYVKFWLGAICWFMFWTFLLIRQLTPVIAYKSIGLVTAIASSALFSSVYFDFKNQKHAFGVIVADEAMIHTGHQAGAPMLLKKPLAEGQEFKVVNERTGWIRIQLPKGQTGWIQKENAQIVYGVRRPHIGSGRE